MKISKEILESFSKAGGLLPQTEMLEVGKAKNQLYIGIPKEISFQENRVALVPESIAVLVSNGHRVVIETNAGKASNFQDNDYSEAGAEIAYSPEAVYKADLILKVAPPCSEEIEMLQRKQTLISALQITVQHDNFLRQLMDKKVNAVAFDFIKDEDGYFPLVRAMGEIAGNTAILIAAEYLSNSNQGQGAMFGGISGVPPTEVVILGAGTVGEFAARSALGLGATVKVFDNSTSKLRRLRSQLQNRIFTSVIQPEELRKALKTADVAIGGIRASEGRTPCIVSEDMVSEMKTGAVIIDISIDQGGCFETSQVTNHTKPTFRKHGVIHYCVPNIASRVSRTASYALSNVFTPLLMQLGEDGGVESMLRRNQGVRNGVYIYNGILTSKFLSEAFGIPYKELDLIMAANI
jgi:alanine dehydrogenase